MYMCDQTNFTNVNVSIVTEVNETFPSTEFEYSLRDQISFD